MDIPATLGWLEDSEQGRLWLTELPNTLAACLADWELRPGEPYAGSYVSYVAPVIDRHGSELVLKIQWPHRESDAEADALTNWDGNGAIRLLAHDPERHALLLERCTPGSRLSTTGPETGLRVMIDLLPRLWVPPSASFNLLADEVDRWITNLPLEFEKAGEPFEKSLLDDVIAILRVLKATQGEQVLLHQDLHADNVLSAQREPWLAIDPKPLVGEREYGLSPIIRSAEFGHSKEHVLYRLDRLTHELGIDRDRARLWAAGQAIAWGFENGQVLPDHIETARWLLAA